MKRYLLFMPFAGILWLAGFSFTFASTALADVNIELTVKSAPINHRLFLAEALALEDTPENSESNPADKTEWKFRPQIKRIDSVPIAYVGETAGFFGGGLLGAGFMLLSSGTQSSGGYGAGIGFAILAGGGALIGVTVGPATAMEMTDGTASWWGMVGGYYGAMIPGLLPGIGHAMKLYDWENANIHVINFAIAWTLIVGPLGSVIVYEWTAAKGYYHPDDDLVCPSIGYCITEYPDGSSELTLKATLFEIRF